MKYHIRHQKLAILIVKSGIPTAEKWAEMAEITVNQAWEDLRCAFSKLQHLQDIVAFAAGMSPNKRYRAMIQDMVYCSETYVLTDLSTNASKLLSIILEGGIYADIIRLPSASECGIFHDNYAKAIEDLLNSGILTVKGTTSKLYTVAEHVANVYEMYGIGFLNIASMEKPQEEPVRPIYRREFNTGSFDPATSKGKWLRDREHSNATVRIPEREQQKAVSKVVNAILARPSVKELAAVVSKLVGIKPEAAIGRINTQRIRGALEANKISGSKITQLSVTDNDMEIATIVAKKLLKVR